MTTHTDEGLPAARPVGGGMEGGLTQRTLCSGQPWPTRHARAI
ncbi:hypothetical protein N8I74_10190 [Chitiniphilus purpureus]|uniref:Uncharacterized protein n=1 Tax=Chitiniphilus purpureus TaxID=2981137 RepID=A0ABY6DP62_9NEIS|nr:hypothetical protein [Chitiniphilus sp. CD1]UXY13693.1 hypothetical protein N8I74_10190 [Chitiniphilus sp. CD1]